MNGTRMAGNLGRGETAREHARGSTSGLRAQCSGAILERPGDEPGHVTGPRPGCGRSEGLFSRGEDARLRRCRRHRRWLCATAGGGATEQLPEQLPEPLTARAIHWPSHSLVEPEQWSRARVPSASATGQAGCQSLLGGAPRAAGR